jgi:SAM-dependent methyltransferase
MLPVIGQRSEVIVSGSAGVGAAPHFVELYERVLVPPLFRPWGEQLLDRVPLAPGARVLDVACGTGIGARLVRQRLGGGAVVGVDRNPAMLALARTIEPAIDWREGDAASLPARDGERFDAVLCHQGVQFFPDRRAAVLEMRRVLAPGGSVGIGVWRSLEENGLFYELGVVAEGFVGPIEDARHGFADAEALRALLIDAGFARIEVEAVTMEVRFTAQPDMLARLNAGAVVGMSRAGKALSDVERAQLVDRIVDASIETIGRYSSAGVIAFPTSANIAVAH